MRKITEEAQAYFYRRHNRRIGNTVIVSTPATTKMLLFGHEIAKIEKEDLYITNAGYFTNTTKERLNGLLGVRIFQKKGVWYLNGTKWNGEWVKVA